MLLGGGLEHSVPRRIGQVPGVPPAPDLQLLEGVPRRFPPPQHRGAFYSSRSTIEAAKTAQHSSPPFPGGLRAAGPMRSLPLQKSRNARAREEHGTLRHPTRLRCWPFIAYLTRARSLSLSSVPAVGHHDATKGQQEPGQPPGEQRRECLLPMHPARTSCAQGSLLLSHLELSWRRSTCSM